ncbi:MAG TPA: hypothetical protein VM487_11135 [Phycisphaerae bacterium]|nr:hypothetical protein [Phycisphaerae bacterium]
MAGKARLEAFIGLNTKGYQRGMRRIRMMTMRWRQDFSRAVMRGARMLAVTFVAATAAAAVGIAAVVRQTARFGDNLGKMAKRTGLSVTFLQKLQHAAELGGNSVEDMEKAVRRVAQAALDTDDGLETYARLFDRLGVNIHDTNGDMKDAETLFMETVSALGAVENSTERVAIATKLLGRSGTRILPMLADGMDGFNRSMQDAQATGGLLSDQDVRNAEEFSDQLYRAKRSIAGFGRGIAASLFPALNAGLEEFTKKFNTMRQGGAFDEFTSKLQSAAAGLMAAVSIIVRSPDKLSLIKDTIVTAFKIGAAYTEAAIINAFGKTKLGQAAAGTGGYFGSMYQDRQNELGKMSKFNPLRGIIADVKTWRNRRGVAGVRGFQAQREAGTVGNAARDRKVAEAETALAKALDKAAAAGGMTDFETQFQKILAMMQGGGAATVTPGKGGGGGGGITPSGGAEFTPQFDELRRIGGGILGSGMAGVAQQRDKWLAKQTALQENMAASLEEIADNTAEDGGEATY